MTDLSFTSFWTQRAPPESKETVVKRALEQLKDSPEAHRELEASINAVVKISGFKNPSTAPVPLLTKPVVRQLDFSNDLAAAVLKAWAKSRQPLHDAVAERLENAGISVDYPDFASGGFRGLWRADDLRRERDALLELHGEFESDDALLMLCYATGRMPSDDETSVENTRQPTSGEPALGEKNMLNVDALAQWKLALNSLPPDSPMWEDEISAFAEWLSNLAAEKLAERGIAIRWREVVSEMSESGPIFDLLSGMALRVDSWSDAEFDSPSSASRALEVAEELKSVLESLDKHLAGRSDLVKVNEFQNLAKNLHGELDAIIASSRRPDDEPPKRKGISAEPSGGDSAPLSASDEEQLQDVTGASDLAEDDNVASVPDDGDARGEDIGGVSPIKIDGEEADGGVSELSAAPTDDSAGGAADSSETSAEDADEGREDAPAEEIAASAGSEDDSAPPDELEAAMWKMVGEDDLSGAYWMARSLEAQNLVLPAPSRLFAAAQGAKWLSPNSDAYVEDLFEIVSGPEIPEKNDVAKLLGLAAALQASVIKPETNLAAWLDSPENCRQIERIVAPIREFGSFGIQPEDVDGQDGMGKLRKDIAEASADAREWLEGSPSLRRRYKAATDVLRHLCADGGEVRAMLSPVIEDFRSGVGDARIHADRLLNDASAGNEVDQIYQRISTGAKLAPSDRNWLVRNIQEAAKKAIRWCNLVERENKSAFGGNEWRMRQVAGLRRGIGDNSGEAFAALDKLRSNSRDAATAAAAGCVARSLARLLAYLRLPTPESAAQPAVSTEAKDLDTIVATRATRADSLKTAMGRRLIWTPSIRLGDDCLPAPDGFAEMGRRLLENKDDPVALGEALKRRVEVHQDYRFYDVMSALLSEKCRADLEALREKSRKASEDAIVGCATDARQDLQQALRDGILEFDSPEWEGFNSQIARFISDDAELNHDANVEDFQTAHEGIEAIQDALGSMRDKKRAELRQIWNDMLERARERADIDESAMQTWETKFSQADDQMDVRVMEVCVTRLSNYLNGDERLLPASRYDSAPHSAFEEFDKFLKGIPDPKERARGSSGLRALANA